MDKRKKPKNSLMGTLIIRPQLIGVAAAVAILLMLILALPGAASAQEIRFTGTVTAQNPPDLAGASWWNVMVEELISGPQTSCDTLRAELIIVPPMGYYESDIAIGDRVEVYGNYTSNCTVSLNGLSYYIVAQSVHNLNTSDDFATIQAAINDADTEPGHTIIVDSGTYYENVIVNKSLTLRGENRDNTIIDGNGSGNVIQLIADDCTIQNFRIQNAGSIAGIYINSHSNRICHNNITSNSREGIYSCYNNNLISDNVIESNGDYGIWLHGSSNNTISNNFINSNHGDGFILVYSSDFNVVSGNYISMNSDGIRIGESNNNLIMNNILLSNDINGVNIQQESNDNLVYHNNYVNNTNHARDDGNNNSWDNGYPGGGNYWGEYNCTDSYRGPDQDIPGPDGLGDMPYTISGAAGAQDKYPLMQPVLVMIRIGYQPSTHHLAHMTAMEKGWWEEDLKRVAVNLVIDREFPSGQEAMRAMSNGEIDIAYVGVAPVIVALDSGLDAKIIASVQTNGSHLALRQEINYTSPEDLAGLRIATFQPCSVMDLVLKRWLVENGLDPESDLEIIPMTSGAAIDAMGNGTVDGVFLPHPDPAIIELNNYGRMVIASGTMWPNHACCCLVVSGRLIREHPDLVRQIVYTHSKATNYITTNHEAAAQTFANKTGMDFGVVNYSLNTWDGTWVSNPRIGLNSSLEIAERMYAEGCVNNSLSKGDLFDLRFYDEMSIFDTGPGSYPSISGTHNGTIRPYRDIAVSTLYTYRCLGTGGHTEYIKIWNSITGWNVTATWNGYKDDWHNLSFNNSFTLYANETYNYTIRTGSYPQIIHEQSWNATGGKITCTDFVDVNGKRHYNWIPAIKLYFVDTSVADLTLEEARAIAQNSSCVQEGTLTDTYIYNEYSRTWWFDLEPFTVMPGCNPACVISEDTRTAEINWRCTMATTP